MDVSKFAIGCFVLDHLSKTGTDDEFKSIMLHLPADEVKILRDAAQCCALPDGPINITSLFSAFFDTDGHLKPEFETVRQATPVTDLESYGEQMEAAFDPSSRRRRVKKR